MGTCRLCQQNKKLIKAHIVPKGFYRYLNPDTTLYPEAKGKSVIIVGGDGKPVNRPIGEYDEGILCADCDGGIGVYDSYAQDIILRAIPTHIGPLESRITNVDYTKLKLFFISLLWRASISTRDVYAKIQLDTDIEEKLRTMILAKDPGTVNDFSVMFQKFTTARADLELVLDKCMMTPVQHHFQNGTAAYMFLFPRGLKVHIKAEDRPLDAPLLKLAFKPGGPMQIFDAGLFENSPEFQLMMKYANL